MAQQTFNNLETRASVRSKLNANAVDAENRIAAIEGVSLLDGLTIANNAIDIVNDIDVSPGYASVSNGTVAKTVKLSTALTKRLDAAWSVGNNSGGLDTGTKANSTWYYIWLIHRSDTGVTDVLFSTSQASPTMPTNYDFKRLLWAVVTNSSGAIVQFFQVGNFFSYNDYQEDLNTASPPTSSTLLRLSVPARRVIAKIIVQATQTNTGRTVSVASGLRSGSNYEVFLRVPIGSADQPGLVQTDDSGRVKYFANLGDSWTVLLIRTQGYYFF